MIHKYLKSVGVIVPQLSNEYWALISEAIQEALWDHGCSLILCSSDNRGF